MYSTTGSISPVTEEHFISNYPTNIQSFLDIGMNQGSYSRMLLKHFPKANVIGVEAVKFFADECKKSLPSKVKILNYALSESEEAIKLFRRGLGANSDPRDSNPSSGQQSETIEVTTRTLDSLWADGEIAAADFVKIDTDGFDLRVLLGGGRFFRDTRPVIQIEVSRYWKFTDSKPVKLDDFCLDFRYELFLMTPTGLRILKSASQIQYRRVSVNCILVPQESSPVFGTMRGS